MILFEPDHRQAYSASNSDPDTLSWDEAMASGDEVPQWLEAARLEIEALTNKKAWVEDEVTNAKGRILPGIWVFRRKRSPDGTIKKWKGRFTIQGNL
jgi:hypothetical protein